MAKRAARLVEILPQLRATFQPRAERIAVKTKGRVLFVDPANVIVVEAERNCVLLQQTSGSCLLRESISAMEEKLAPYGFVRIHRSVLINSAFVHEIQPWPTGEYVLRVKGPREQKEYTVHSSLQEELKAARQVVDRHGKFRSGIIGRLDALIMSKRRIQFAGR